MSAPNVSTSQWQQGRPGLASATGALLFMTTMAIPAALIVIGIAAEGMGRHQVGGGDRVAADLSAAAVPGPGERFARGALAQLLMLAVPLAGTLMLRRRMHSRSTRETRFAWHR